MTKLESGKTLKREIKVYGVEAPVQMEMTSDGLSFWVKGNKKKIRLSWGQAVEHSFTPGDVPSFLADKPLEFLKYQAAKTAKRKAG